MQIAFERVAAMVEAAPQPLHFFAAFSPIFAPFFALICATLAAAWLVEAFDYAPTRRRFGFGFCASGLASLGFAMVSAYTWGLV